MAYGSGCMGYVIMTTLATACFGAGFQALSSLRWTVVGRGCAVDRRGTGLFRRFGSRTALAATFEVKAFDVGLLLADPNAAKAIAGGLLFSRTFMAITALSLVSAEVAGSASGHRIMG